MVDNQILRNNSSIRLLLFATEYLKVGNERQEPPQILFHAKLLLFKVRVVFYDNRKGRKVDIGNENCRSLA